MTAAAARNKLIKVRVCAEYMIGKCVKNPYWLVVVMPCTLHICMHAEKFTTSERVCANYYKFLFRTNRVPSSH